MKRYEVIFEDSAQTDVLNSYDWGCRFWGKKEAKRWVRELRNAILRQLSILPKGFPVIVCCSPFEKEKFTSSTLEGPTVFNHR